MGVDREPEVGADSGSVDFPLTESFLDFAAEPRQFEITCLESGLGFTVTALEVGKGGLGYEFSCFHPSSPYVALGRLRSKVHCALSQRHLHAENGQPVMAGDTLEGRVAWLGEEEGIGFVVDGQVVTLEDLARFATTHEGLGFVLRFLDAGARSA